MRGNIRLVILAGAIGLCVIGLGLLEITADGSTRFLNRHGDAVWERQSAHVGREATRAEWTGHLRRMEEALGQQNVSAAVRAWHDAYVAGLGSRGWEGLVEVADAYLRIGEVPGFRKASEAKARQIYLTAFFRARQQGSLDGVLRTAEAFAALGDREVAEQALSLAQRLAAQTQDEHAQQRVRAATERSDPRYVERATSGFHYEP
ncbi:MAG: hypothetical protein HY613_01610 [Candidatus Rokubacteria bacterium]|nr:hypothetical protein [Candidatus Rokubacteria bacterium]